MRFEIAARNHGSVSVSVAPGLKADAAPHLANLTVALELGLEVGLIEVARQSHSSNDFRS